MTFQHPRPLFASTDRPVPLGITEPPEYVDAPGHVADLAQYRALEDAIVGNLCAIVTDRPEDLVEVHPPSRGMVDLGGLMVERCPARPGTTVSGGRNRDRAGDEYDAGVLKDPLTVGNGV